MAASMVAVWWRRDAGRGQPGEEELYGAGAGGGVREDATDRAKRYPENQGADRVSKYRVQPLDLSGLKTVPIASRGGKVRTADFARGYQKGSGVGGWIDSLPKILAGESFRAVVNAL